MVGEEVGAEVVGEEEGTLVGEEEGTAVGEEEGTVVGEEEGVNVVGEEEGAEVLAFFGFLVFCAFADLGFFVGVFVGVAVGATVFFLNDFFLFGFVLVVFNVRCPLPCNPVAGEIVSAAT